MTNKTPKLTRESAAANLLAMYKESVLASYRRMLDAKAGR